METFVAIGENKITCTLCDSTFVKNGKSRHMKTKKHQYKFKDESCPICFDELVPKATRYMVCKQHKHCDTCFKKIGKCSICRAPKSTFAIRDKAENLIDIFRCAGGCNVCWEYVYDKFSEFTMDLHEIIPYLDDDFSDNIRETIINELGIYCKRENFNMDKIVYGVE